MARRGAVPKVSTEGESASVGRGRSRVIRIRSVLKRGRFVFSECVSHYRRGLFLITQHFSLRVPDLQAVPVDYVVIWTQGLGGLERQFEGLKRLHGVAAVSRDVKRSV